MCWGDPKDHPSCQSTPYCPAMARQRQSQAGRQAEVQKGKAFLLFPAACGILCLPKEAAGGFSAALEFHFGSVGDHVFGHRI